MYIKGIRNEFSEVDSKKFPFSIPAIQTLELLKLDCPVTFLTGDNGTGKSTIIETLAGLMEMNMEGGSKNNLFSNYLEENTLLEYCRLIRYPKYPKDNYFYRAESYFNLMTDLEELEQDRIASGMLPMFDRKMHHYSRGESLKELLDKRFFGHGVYLLDEPETGLSLQSQLEVLVYIRQLVEKDSQFVIATHSPILLLYPEAKIYEIGTMGLSEKVLEETKIMQDWEMIMDRKHYFIQQLFQNE